MKKYIVLTLVLGLWLSQLSLSGQKHSDSESLSIWVNGACGMCETRIEKTALKGRGVISADYHLEEKTLHLEVSDKFKLERLHYSLASVGHDTRELLAPDAIYNALPACCHYRTEDEHMQEEDDHNEGMIDDDHDPNSSDEDDIIITGRVVEIHKGHADALPGTNVYWTGTTQGVITDKDGYFEIALDPDAHYLVFSYVGYGKDSVHVHDAQNLVVEFTNTQSIEEVKVVYNVAPTRIDLSGAFDVQLLDSKELLKCACCNLSESFETNPSVDATVTDAVTGTRQIQMLGLAGQFVQINRENMPLIRGLSTLNGLSFVPGSWISGIQLNTGTGSVVNGFESITGQINVELKKPENSEKLYLNLFGSTEGMMEANMNSAFKINDNLSTGILLHAKYQPFELDHNGDGFMDHPAVRNGIFMNRWSYKNDKGINVIFGIKGVWSESMSGQVDYNHDLDLIQPNWGAEINTQRLEAFMKIGKVFPDRPYSSIGFQLSGMYHNQDAYFGRRSYDGTQNSLYANLIYMGIFGNTNHQYRTGLSFQYDDYTEQIHINGFDRIEAVPGIFLEYTFNYLDKFTMVPGIRADFHNHYGIFYTPRLHLRYAPREHTLIRGMIGRGQKSPNMFAENIGMLASSRQIMFSTRRLNIDLDEFEPEIAWNTGISAAQEFKLAEKDGLVKLDYYYTWFISQVIMNFDRNPGAVYIENLNGKSYSHSIQALLNYELFRNYHIRLAYRFNDVRMTIDDELLVKPLTPHHRAFLNMAYETGDLWTFDMTWNWQGMKRIPVTSSNPEEFQMDEWSPNFFLLNAQISKTFRENFDIYVGAENILNYKQQDPIIDAANPFGEYFDASMIWGPVFGRKVYGGLRLRL